MDYHEVSVNSNLNPYAFLLTLVHEIAHLKVFVQRGRGVKPHGPEWKQTFAALMDPLLEGDIFPSELRDELKRHMLNPSATSTADHNLMRSMKEYDSDRIGWVEVGSLISGSRFSIKPGWTMEWHSKERKRILCKRLENQRFYRVHPLLEVKPL
jgi:hypothetical protein